MQFYDFELTSGLLALYDIMRICEDIPYKLQIYSQRFVCLFVFVYFSFIFFVLKYILGIGPVGIWQIHLC